MLSIVVVVPETVRFPEIATFPLPSERTIVPVALGNVIARSAVGSATCKVVSKSFAVAPSKTTPVFVKTLNVASSSATPDAAPLDVRRM